MKKIIPLLFLTQIAFSQVCTIDYVTPDTVCNNQPIKIHISMTYTNLNSWSRIDISDSLPNNINPNPVLTATYQEWHDSSFTLTIQNNNALYNGISYLLVVNGGSTNRIKVIRNNCIQSIENYNNKETIISTEYYNLLGQPIKQTEGITVEVKTYLGGYREIRKIIL